MPVAGDILVRSDGTPLDGKIISQTAAQIVFQPDGSDVSATQKLERTSIQTIVKTDEHGAAIKPPDAHPVALRWQIPPEPAAPPVQRLPLGARTYYVIPLHGEVGDTVLARALEKSLADAVLRKPTVVVLDINSPGGLVEESQQISKIIHHYNKLLRIVALTDQDLSAAAIFSLSIKEIYVKSSSTIGAATAYQPDNLTLPPKIEEKMQSAWRATARNSAEEGGHEPLLAEAMIDNDMELHLETSNGKPVVKEGPGDKTLCKKGKILTLSSHEAVECGLAAGEADDVAELGTALKMPGWSEIKGLGTLLADYLPKRNEVFKQESIKIMSDLQQNFNEAKESDPAEVIQRVVRTGAPTPPQPMRPNRFGPPGIRPIPRPGMPNQNTTVITTVSKRHWKSRTLICVLALQKVEQNLADEAALCDAFGHSGGAETFGDAQTQLGTIRARIYDDRNKYGDDTQVAAAPPPQATPPPQTQPSNPQVTMAQPNRNAMQPRRTSPFFDRRMPAGATKSELVGGGGGGQFVHVNPSGSPLLGFRYALGNWGGNQCLRQLDPIYDKPADNDASSVIARDGYVVAGVNLQKDQTNVTAVQIIFARYKDGNVTTSDTYKSDWIGNSTGQDTVQLAGKGEKVIGTYGRKGLNLDAIGLVFAPSDAASH